MYVLLYHLREKDIGIFCFFEGQEFFAILCPFQLIKENEELSVVDVLPDFLYGMRRHSSWIMEMSEVFFEILEGPRSKVWVCLRNESIVSLSRSWERSHAPQKTIDDVHHGNRRSDDKGE